jgi:YidC/Oxa1 family membrane protein insertase
MPVVTANIFQPIIDVFEQVLLFFHDHVGLGWGLSIIFMTLAIRAVMIPLTFKQFHSMQAMQRLAPEIKALQEKYKDDRQRLNQEMMKFYSENKVNPFGSCLPLVLQMPVFISLFYMLRKDLKEDICGPALRAAGKVTSSAIQSTNCEDVARHSANFLFIPDLTAAATGGVLVALLVLYVGSQLLSSLLMPSTVDKNQRYIMLALPFVFVLFVRNFPAGLLVYWITTNLWTVTQSYIMRRMVGGPPVPPAPTAASGNGDGDAKPGFLQRLAQGAGATSPAPAASGARGGSSSSGSGSGGGSGAGGAPKRATAPPPPPRRKKKRSGRRR